MIIQFDLTITESQTTPAFRQQTNEFLMQLFGAGQISIEDLLENGAFPFADRLLQSIEKKKQEMAEMQQQMQSEQGINAQVQPDEQLLQQMMQQK